MNCKGKNPSLRELFRNHRWGLPSRGTVRSFRGMTKDCWSWEEDWRAADWRGVRVRVGEDKLVPAAATGDQSLQNTRTHSRLCPKRSNRNNSYSTEEVQTLNSSGYVKCKASCRWKRRPWSWCPCLCCSEWGWQHVCAQLVFLLALITLVVTSALTVRIQNKTGEG